MCSLVYGFFQYSVFGIHVVCASSSCLLLSSISLYGYTIICLPILSDEHLSPSQFLDIYKAAMNIVEAS